MKYGNRDVELNIVAKVNYTNGFIGGFLRGARLGRYAEAAVQVVRQADVIVAAVMFVAGSVIALFLSKFV